MKNPITKAPSTLSRAAQRRWRAIVNEFELSASELIVLEEGLLAWDRLGQARALLDRDGLVVATGAGGLKPHPAANVEAESRRAVFAAFRQLGLDTADESPRKPGRPPGSGSLFS